MTIQLCLSLFQPSTYQLLFTFITLIFIWGTNLVIESINVVYNVLAPLSISYHYALVVEGILHTGTVIYILLLPLIFYGLNYATKESN